MTYPIPNPHVEHINTNERYRRFMQTYFTAGDEEQFMKKLIRSTPTPIPDLLTCIPSNYICFTFRYIFYKFKKGIFIQIRNNKVINFLPFSWIHFINEWSDRIETDEHLLDFLIHSKKLCGYGESSKNINMTKETWYANNNLIRTEYPIHEGDTGVPIIKDMMEELCKTETVPDIDFFVNRRDYPLLRSLDNGERKEPYVSMFGRNTPLLSHNYEHYFPILSMSHTIGYDDIAIPTTEDWARIRSGEFKYFEHSHDYNYEFETDWKNKKNIAVFRGTATGEGTTILTNMRLKLASMMKDYSDIMDVGLTGWSSRPRKEEGNSKLTLIDPSAFDFDLVSPLTPVEQSKFKYIINISGHVCAYRLSLELSMGSVVLLQESKHTLWFYPLLIPYVHYIPIKEDLSDLVEKINWCREHDTECEEIAQNSMQFYKDNLLKGNLLSFLKDILINCRNTLGNYKFGIDKSFIIKYVNTHTKIKKPKKYSNTQLERYRNTDDPTYLNFYSILTPKIQDMIIGNKLVICKEIKSEYEYYIGLEINKMLKYIPNFRYTFRKYKTHLILEKIEGVTLADYIQSNEFRFDEWIYIICTTVLSITFAQNLAKLTHYDLNPWNIIVKRKPLKVNYYIEPHTYTCFSDVYPVIIDYDKSRIIFKDLKIVVGDTLTYNQYVDIIFLLYNSIFIILQTYFLDRHEMFTIRSIVEKISGRKFNSIPELKLFLNIHNKYNVILYEARKKRKYVTNIEFVDWLLDLYPLPNIVKTNEKIIDCRYGDEKVISSIMNNELPEISSHTPSIDFSLQGVVQRENKNVNFLRGDVLCECDEESVEKLEDDQFRTEFFSKHSSKEYKSITNISNFKTMSILIENYK